MLAGVAREIGQVAEQLDAVEADVGVAAVRPQLERGAQVAQRLGEGACVLGLQAGGDRRPQGLLAPARRAPVDGQLGVGARVADRLRDRAVDGRPLPRQQIGVDGLAHDVVAERERVALAVVDEQVVVDRVAQRAPRARARPCPRRRRAGSPPAGRPIAAA